MISAAHPTATPAVEPRILEGIATVEDLDEVLATIAEIRAETGAVVQLFDARYVVSRDHLTRAVGLAERAAARDETIARDRAVEVLLYAAGRRQIDRALEMGVSEGEIPTVAIVYTPPTSGDTDESDEFDLAAAVDRVGDLLSDADTLGQYDRERVMDFFDISDQELAATTGTLADVVLERVALLDVEK